MNPKQPLFNQKKKLISLSGTGVNETDYVLKLNIHRGLQTGDDTGKDIFLKDCKTDFSDIRFIDQFGNNLEYYIQSHGNYEVIPDSKRLGSRSIQYNGKIYGLPSWETPGVHKTYVTENDGNTWALFDATRSLIAIDSRGYFYAISGGIHLWRSTDEGATWTEVLTMPSRCTIQLDGWAEDSTGVLYAGRYQTDEDAVIYKSVDGGENWMVAWSDATLQHIHGVYVDPYTDYVYAGVDDAVTADIKMIRSIDNGANWTTLVTGHLGAFSVMVATPYGRFFAGGAMAPCIGYTVYKTTDDVTFTSVIRSSNSLQGLRVLGNHIYGFGTTYGNSNSAEIYQMDLDGSNAKIIWNGDYDTDNNFKGWQEIGVAGIPNTTNESQLLLGYRNGNVTYKGTRVFDGGDHYQSIFHIKIPFLPATGIDINVISGNHSAKDVGSINIYDDLVMSNALVHFRLDAGEGTTVINLANGGQNANGTIMHFDGYGGWNNYGVRNCGKAYPPIVVGRSYNFNNKDYVQINTSTLNDVLTKDFSIIMWIKSSALNVNDTLFYKNASGVGGFRFQIGGINGNLKLRVDDATNNYVVSNSPYGAAVGHECMAGIVIDNASPSNVKFICNGVISDPIALAIDIPSNTGSPRIGTSTGGSEALTGDIGEVQVYGYQLTELQIRQLYENRLLSATEPLVLTTLL